MPSRQQVASKSKICHATVGFVFVICVASSRTTLDDVFRLLPGFYDDDQWDMLYYFCKTTVYSQRKPIGRSLRFIPSFVCHQLVFVAASWGRVSRVSSPAKCCRRLAAVRLCEHFISRATAPFHHPCQKARAIIASMRIIWQSRREQLRVVHCQFINTWRRH